MPVPAASYSKDLVMGDQLVVSNDETLVSENSFSHVGIMYVSLPYGFPICVSLQRQVCCAQFRCWQCELNPTR